MTISKPMLAETITNINSLKFPLLASPKLDGIRCIVKDGKALTRKFKPVPNIFVREWIEANLPNGIDGELMIDGNFNEVQSAIMKASGQPNFIFCAFDLVGENGIKENFSDRYHNLVNYIASQDAKHLRLVKHEVVKNPEELLSFEAVCIAEGYEGVMVRTLTSPYKCGRSTLKEGFLLKLKRFEDSEAVVMGLEEMMTNTNEKTEDALGHSKRSSKKEGKVPAGKLGKFKVRDIVTGIEFEIGTGEGLTMELRQEIWDNQSDYIGKFVKYKHQPVLGAEKPRFPVWLGMRHQDDM